jgi:hypothetical protein
MVVMCMMPCHKLAGVISILCGFQADWPCTVGVDEERSEKALESALFLLCEWIRSNATRALGRALSQQGMIRWIDSLPRFSYVTSSTRTWFNKFLGSATTFLLALSFQNTGIMAP